MKLSNFHLAIGVPCTFPFVPADFFYSFVHLERPNYTFIHADNGPVDTLRNDIVEKGLSLGATHLLMMDVDQVYGDPKTITKLLAHKLPIVAARVHRRYPPFDPIFSRLTDTGYQPIEDYEPGSLVECDATGCGCILYDMEVFRVMPYPWFRFRKDEATGLITGEDFGFCQDLKAAGYRIFVDTSVEVGHITHMIVNEATYKLYRAMKGSREAKRAALGALDEDKQHEQAMARALGGEVATA